MLALVLLAGCTPQDAAAPPATVAAAPADETEPAVPVQPAGMEQGADEEGIDAGEASAPPAPAGVSITKAQLLGSFHADSNRDRIIEIRADGRYALTGGAVWDRVESTWSLDNNGTWLRLHPDHHDTEDLLFVVESPDVLVLINNDGSATRFRASYLRVKP